VPSRSAPCAQPAATARQNLSTAHQRPEIAAIFKPAPKYNDFLAHAWESGVRELMVVETVTTNSRRIRAKLYLFFPVDVPLMRPGTGKSSPLRWLLGPGRDINWK